MDPIIEILAVACKLDFRSYELAVPGASIRAAIADGVARCGSAPPGLRMLAVPAAGAFRRGGRHR